MKMITRNTDYAVRAICYLAKAGKGAISVCEMVEELGIPRPFLRKILQILGRKGLVISQKGIGGGFRLALRPQRIRISDIASIFQGEIKMNECLFRKMACPNRRRCPLKKKLDAIEARAVAELGSITIASLI